MATTQTIPSNLTVKITLNERGSTPGKLAEAELHFNDGVLGGLKLIGFAIWERRAGGGRNVTFPARQYAVNGERRSFALLRQISERRQPPRTARCRTPLAHRRPRGCQQRADHPWHHVVAQYETGKQLAAARRAWERVPP